MNDETIIYQWYIYTLSTYPVTLYDGSTAQYERVKMKDVVKIIAIQDNQLLILDQEQPHRGSYLDMPGWLIESHEDVMQAARRELLEETWCEASERIHYKTVEFWTVQWSIHYVIAKNCRQTTEPKTDTGERITTKLVSLETFLDKVDSEELKGSAGIQADMVKVQLLPERYQEFCKLCEIII